MKPTRQLKAYIAHYPRPALLLWVIGLLYAGRIAALSAFPRSVRQTPLLTYGSLAIIYGVFLLVVWRVVRPDFSLRKELGLVWAGGRLALTLALGLGTLALAVVLVGGNRIASRPPADSFEIWIAIIIGTSLLVPLVEELIFRSLLLAYLSYWLPRHLTRWPWSIPGTALVLTALAFALAHLGSSPVFLAVLFIGGLIYGWVRLQSGSLLPSFAGHAAWNGVLVLGQFLHWLL